MIKLMKSALRHSPRANRRSGFRRAVGISKTGHTQTTRRMFNPNLVFSQKYDSLEQARKIELRIKKLKRRDYIEKIIRDGNIKMV